MVGLTSTLLYLNVYLIYKLFMDIKKKNDLAIQCMHLLKYLVMYNTLYNLHKLIFTNLFFRCTYTS